MDFLKKHYEKVLLAVVLVGLLVGAGFLPLMITSERAAMKAKAEEIIQRRVNELPPLNLSTQENLVVRLGSKLDLDFASNHRLFNPVLWQQRPDGTIIKIETGREVGPDAVILTKTTPLYTTITLEGLTPSDSGPRYDIGVEREAASKPALRPKKHYFGTLNNKNEVFVIREAKGPPGNPTELVLEMSDTMEPASVSKDKPFKRVDGYMADLKYPPDNKTWSNQRVGAELKLSGDVYNIVAISENEVVLSAKSNQKKTPVALKPAP